MSLFWPLVAFVIVNSIDMSSMNEKQKLSQKALENLRDVLRKDIGPEKAMSMDEEELNDIGNLLLALLCESLKIKVVNPELSIKK